MWGFWWMASSRNVAPVLETVNPSIPAKRFSSAFTAGLTHSVTFSLVFGCLLWVGVLKTSCCMAVSPLRLMGDKRKGYHPSKSYTGKATKIEQEKPKNLVRARQCALRGCWCPVGDAL